jgi:sn-glycerol 3-phosphate transport system ATP-binding protein
MADLELTHVKKRFGKTEVVRDVSLAVENGEFIVLVGPSGCGKSTLLRMVAGLEEVSDGQIRIGERVVNDLEPKDRDIAMVFQNYALYPHMSVFDNMAYGLKIRRLSSEEIRRKVDQAARILELGPLLARTPRELSGGQRQRVAMGRAIVREPAVFLFDEPLSNLDAKLRVQMRLEIQKLHQRLATTSLYVTHDQVEAMTLAQRMVVLNAGAVEQVGTPDEVYRSPASTFVASFIGSPPMNLIPGTVDSDGAHFLAEGGASLALARTRRELAGRPLILGIRPEDLSIGEGTWSLQVELVESLGAELLVHTRVGPSEIVVRCDARVVVKAGESVTTRPLDGALHWFDASTQRRVENLAR